MKTYLFFLLLFTTTASQAQKIGKPKKDTHFGKNTTVSDMGVLVPRGKKFSKYHQLFAYVLKTSDDLIYLRLEGEILPQVFIIEPTDSLTVTFTDKTTVFLKGKRKHMAYIGPSLGVGQKTLWENDYMLDASAIEQFKTKEIESVFVKSKEKNRSEYYEVITDKRDWVKNALQLL